MAALNLPAPDSLFSTYTTAMTNLSAMLGALSKLGADATVAEMMGATTGLEMLAAIAGISAAAYTGAVIGSLMVAASDSMVCTNSAQVSSSVTRWAARNRVSVPAPMLAFLQRNPEVIVDSSARSGYASRHRAATSRKQAALA
ncbi:hypothetical protein [Trinickia sp.]|uniref:hypothetical protein n=1 Tax=Trinickia sp. TaxID=2571163 RepID=UPI003F7DD576